MLAGAAPKTLPAVERGEAASDAETQILLGNYLSDGRKGIPNQKAQARCVWYQQA